MTVWIVTETYHYGSGEIKGVFLKYFDAREFIGKKYGMEELGESRTRVATGVIFWSLKHLSLDVELEEFEVK